MAKDYLFNRSLVHLEKNWGVAIVQKQEGKYRFQEKLELSVTREFFHKLLTEICYGPLPVYKIKLIAP